MSGRQTPNEFLKQIIGRPVVVKLNNGADYRGELQSSNKRLNVSLTGQAGFKEHFLTRLIGFRLM